MLEKNTDTSSLQQINVGNNLRLGIYRYATGNNVANQYIHLKTTYNVTLGQNLCVKFKGYAYGAAQAVNAIVCAEVDGSINNVGSYGSHICSMYESSDGFAVLTLFVNFCYYCGLSLDQINVEVGDMIPVDVTASTNSSSATGVY